MALNNNSMKQIMELAAKLEKENPEMHKIMEEVLEKNTSPEEMASMKNKMAGLMSDLEEKLGGADGKETD